MGMRGCRHKLSAPGGPPDVGRGRSERNTRGGSGSGKGSPACTGQGILLSCGMRRRAHVPRRSQDHLRVNGVDKRRGVGVDPCSRCSSALPAHKTTSWGRGGVPGRLCVDILSQNVPRSNDPNSAALPVQPGGRGRILVHWGALRGGHGARKPRQRRRSKSDRSADGW